MGYDSFFRAPPSPPPTPLTKVEVAAIPRLVAHFNAFDPPLSEREMMFLSQETMRRFLAVTRGNVEATIARLEATIRFRREMRLDDIDAIAPDAERELCQGTRYMTGFSKGMPLITIWVNRNALPSSQRTQVQNIFMLERCTDLAPAGQTQVVTIMSFYGPKMGPMPTVRQARDFLHNLGAHYPLCTNLNVLADMNKPMRTFLRIVWPFIDSGTKRTTRIKNGAKAVKDGDIDGDCLTMDMGGQLDYTYDHKTYWPAFISACKARREAYLANWRDRGEPTVGRSEREWKFIVHPT